MFLVNKNEIIMSNDRWDAGIIFVAKVDPFDSIRCEVYWALKNEDETLSKTWFESEGLWSPL